MGSPTDREKPVGRAKGVSAAGKKVAPVVTDKETRRVSTGIVTEDEDPVVGGSGCDPGVYSRSSCLEPDSPGKPMGPRPGRDWTGAIDESPNCT